MRKVLALLLSLVMTLTLLVPATWAEEKPAAGYQLPASLKGKTVILHTNDVHGAIDKYAKVAALKNECYDRGASAVVLLDAGDFSQGSTYVSLSKGATAVELMNAVGYDAVTLGNHEFDYGFPQLKANLSYSAADFLVTCVNLVDDEGAPIFAPGATAPVTDADDNPLFNLTVMGVATPETQTKANPALMKGLTFLSGQKLYDAANAVIKVAREEGNADIVIALTHLGVDASSEPNRSIDFVKNVPGVDIVIDGHSHTVMTANKDNGMIQSTGTGLAYVGAFVIDNATKSVESNGLIDLSTYTKEDASVKAIADKIIGEVDAEYGKVFAKTEVELNGDKEPGNRTEETNMGDLITDAMMWAVKTRMPSINMENAVAITNGGGIRAAIKAGDITKKDINTVLPFGNTLSIVKVTGAELLEALEASTYCTPDSIGGFPQVSGIVYTIDGTKTYDAGDVYEGSTYHAPKTIRRVTIQSVGGKAFNLRTVYTIATNDFLAAGGDTYYAFKTASVNYDLGIPMDEVVMDYVKTELKGVVSAENYGEAGDRITIIKGLPFTDVDPSAAYYSAVKYCYENNIFKGVTDTMFMPNNTITRGQMVTVLWRMNGSPEPKNANPFGDVAATSPFVKAIAWAAENKLTNGITETTFAPAQAISRQQFLTILYRYAQFMGYDVSVGEDTNILSFEDVGEVGEYAIPAMQWAVGSGVLAAEKTLTPRAAAPRYNVAEFLANFCMKVIPTAEMMPKAA